jgi:hypothetical protein
MAFYFPDSYDSEDATSTISPLPPVLRQGLAAVATFGFLSFFSSVTLFIYLTYKLIAWQVQPQTDGSGYDAQKSGTSSEPLDSPTRSDDNGFLVSPLDSQLGRQTHERPRAGSPQRPLAERWWDRLRREPPNQFLVLIYNLLFADIQQAMAFLLNVTWLSRDSVQVGSAACWTQGWFISTGDLASSVFISAIAGHTYLGVVRGYRLPTSHFYAAIACMWGFVYGMALLGIIITRNGEDAGGLYVRAGAWVSLVDVILIPGNLQKEKKNRKERTLVNRI